MTITVSLSGKDAEAAVSLLQNAVDIFTTRGLNVSIDNIQTVDDNAQTPEEPTVPCCPCGCVDGQCSCVDSSCGCSACASSIESTIDSQPEIPVPPTVEPTIDEPTSMAAPVAIPLPAVTRCKILNLSTQLDVEIQVDPNRQNTALLASLTKVGENGVVRFTFNDFQHALPKHVEDSRDISIVNTGHSIGPDTVRLVIDIDGKTYPSLVDIEEGDRHVLVIGADLFHIIGESNVSRE